jgi:O-antigen ligase
VSKKTIPAVVRWSFLLFVFTLPFENMDFSFTSGSLSLSKISGLLFFASYFFYYSPFSRRRSFPPIPTAIRCFLAYLAVFALSGLALPQGFTFLGRLFTLVQLVVLFWVVSDLLEEKRMMLDFLITLSFATSFLALGTLLNIPGFAAPPESVEALMGRKSSFGFDPNSFATLQAVAVVILIGLLLNRSFQSLVGKTLLLGPLLPLLIGIVSTGSRTGFAALIAGVAGYMLVYRQVKRKITAAIFVSITIAAAVYLVLSDPVSLPRWQESLYEGKLAGRENITREAIGMVLERPIFGWQYGVFSHELGSRLGYLWEEKDAHNLFLHLFLEVGAAGAIPFLAGLALCVVAAWRGRKTRLGNLPLAALLTLLTANLALTMIAWKIFWLILALVLAAEAAATRREGKYGWILVYRPLRSNP